MKKQENPIPKNAIKPPPPPPPAMGGIKRIKKGKAKEI